MNNTNNELENRLVHELLELTYDKQWGHTPSALSQFSYLFHLYLKYRDCEYIIGKPWGAQAYYVLWKHLGLLKSFDNLSAGVKTYECPFVKYSEETMGNAVGVAIGVAQCTNKTVLCNISESCLQIGETLEALNYIENHTLSNLIVTIDCNHHQVHMEPPPLHHWYGKKISKNDCNSITNGVYYIDTAKLLPEFHYKKLEKTDILRFEEEYRKIYG